MSLFQVQFSANSGKILNVFIVVFLLGAFYFASVEGGNNSRNLELSDSPIYFHCYGGKHNPYTIVESIHVKFDCIDPTTMNVIFFPDWYNKPSKNDTAVNKMYYGLLKNGLNPVIVNYENILEPLENFADTQTGLQKAKSKIPLLVERLTDLVQSPYHLYSLTNVRYIGFGLGAQIISKWARATQTRPLRVTALDPVGNGFSKRDGQFVDVLHTSKGLFNPEAETIGHVDIRANVESEIQPGCIFSKDPFCSHEKAIDYFVESINSSKKFPLCQNGFDYLLDQCEVKEKIAFMGYHLTDAASGNFYFSTNPTEPYAKGTKGLGAFPGAGMVSFDCYNGQTPTRFTFKDLLASPFEVPSKLEACNPKNKNTTVFYFPDWTNVPPSSNEPTIQKLTQALKKRNAIPVILNYDPMLKAVVRQNQDIVNFMPALEILTAFSLYSVNMTGDTRFVGFGMGTQIISNAAEVMKRISKGNVTLPRITALNPYGLKFNKFNPSKLKENANFVDVIHTGALGYKHPIGHVDFYPNFPSAVQPNCQNSNKLCSHQKAIDLYIQSIATPNIFPTCADGVKYLTKSCELNENSIVYMGYDLNTTLVSAGLYYLTTNSRNYGNSNWQLKNAINFGYSNRIDPMNVPQYVFERENDLSFQCYKTSVTNFDLLLFKDLLPLNETSKFNRYFNYSHTLIFYFPDWAEKPSKHEENVENVVEAYLHKDLTPIVVNYEKLMEGYTSFESAQKIMRKLEYLLAVAIMNLNSTKNIRFTGYGAGAQIISAMAKTYTSLTNRKITRITALDPFSISITNKTRILSKNDAEFVDVIHTSFGGRGIRSYGHVDFYPNYPDSNQPGCSSKNLALNSICNHQKSLDYFLESLKHSEAFPTCKRSIVNLLNTCTKQDDLVYMGYEVNRSESGLYYLKTNSKPPYGFGLESIPLNQHTVIENNKPPQTSAVVAEEQSEGNSSLEQGLENLYNKINGYNITGLGFHCYRNIRKPSKKYFLSFKDILTTNFTANFSKCTGNSKRTIIYYPDWNSNPSGPSISSISKAFLQKRVPTLVVNYQSLVINASKIAMPCNLSASAVTEVPSYAEILHIIPNIAEISAKIVIRLEENRIRLQKGRFVGFGMGAQILSTVSKIYHQKTGKKFRRITALDPAGPGFHTNRFSKDNTEFVDVIHTNTKMYGFPEPIGHIDFYVNFPNTFQPGCFASDNIYERDICKERFAMCSHQRAWQYYIESITNPKGFPGCKEKLPFLLDTCKALNETAVDAYMGFGVKTNASGVYYLRPNENSPFGLGFKGLGVKKEAYSDLRLSPKN